MRNLGKRVAALEARARVARERRLADVFVGVERELRARGVHRPSVTDRPPAVLLDAFFRKKGDPATVPIIAKLPLMLRVDFNLAYAEWLEGQCAR